MGYSGGRGPRIWAVQKPMGQSSGGCLHGYVLELARSYRHGHGLFLAASARVGGKGCRCRLLVVCHLASSGDWNGHKSGHCRQEANPVRRKTTIATRVIPRFATMRSPPCRQSVASPWHRFPSCATKVPFLQSFLHGAHAAWAGDRRNWPHAGRAACRCRWKRPGSRPHNPAVPMACSIPPTT